LREVGDKESFYKSIGERRNGNSFSYRMG